MEQKIVEDAQESLKRQKELEFMRKNYYKELMERQLYEKELMKQKEQEQLRKEKELENELVNKQIKDLETRERNYKMVIFCDAIKCIVLSKSK